MPKFVSDLRVRFKLKRFCLGIRHLESGSNETISCKSNNLRRGFVIRPTENTQAHVENDNSNFNACWKLQCYGFMLSAHIEIYTQNKSKMIVSKVLSIALLSQKTKSKTALKSWMYSGSVMIKTFTVQW